jgi:Short C-terminal domain
VLNPAASATSGDRQDVVVGGPEILSSRVRRELDRQVSEVEQVLFCLRGSLSHSLIALDERLLIVKPGFHAGTTFGTLTTTFYYQDVTGIQLHTFLFTGWIEVSSPSFQGRERKKNRQPRTSDRDVYKLPNCIPVAKKHVDAYQPALAQLRERIGLSKRFGKVAWEAPPVIASLERIASLRASGALSEEEYERLKEVLLESAGRGTAVPAPAFYTSSGG